MRGAFLDRTTICALIILSQGNWCSRHQTRLGVRSRVEHQNNINPHSPYEMLAGNVGIEPTTGVLETLMIPFH